jgi:hypothetical protein
MTAKAAGTPSRLVSITTPASYLGSSPTTTRNPGNEFAGDRPAAEIIADYRDQCARSEAVLAMTPLSAPPRGGYGDPEMEPPNVRWVVLHMIEETARHAGHLEIARELLDGQTGLGPR